MEEKKEELREKLREKLSTKKLTRTSRVVRENELQELEKKLRKNKNKKRKGKKLSPTEKKRIRERIKLLQEIEEKDCENYENSLSGDFVDYSSR